jgi:predicted Zn finger-like uncharacterized protein
MKFVCDSCEAQYMISDEKVGKNGVKVRCKKCSHVIIVRPAAAEEPSDATVVMDNPLAGLDDTQEAPAFEDIGADAEIGAAFDSIFGGEEGGLDAGEGDDEGSDGDAFVTDPAHPSPPAPAASSDPFSAAVDSAFDAALGDAPLPEEDENEGEFQATRVFSTADMQRVAEEREYATGPDDDGLPGIEEDPAPESGGDEESEWYVAIDDEQIGPLTVAEVQRHWEAGDLSPDSLVWKSSMADWDPLSTVDELKHLIAPTPASPGWQPAAEASGRGDEPDAQDAEAPAAAASDDEAPAWKPAAASLLASLAAEEMSALENEPEEGSDLAGPTADPIAAAEDAPAAPSPDEPGGLGLDLPPPPPAEDDDAIPPPPEPSGAPSQPAFGPANGGGASPMAAPFMTPPAAAPAPPMAMGGGMGQPGYQTPPPAYGGYGAAAAAPPPPAGMSTGKLMAIVGGIGGPILILATVLVIRGIGGSGTASADEVTQPPETVTPAVAVEDVKAPEAETPAAETPEPAPAEAVAEAESEADAAEAEPEEPQAVAQAQPQRQQQQARPQPRRQQQQAKAPPRQQAPRQPPPSPPPPQERPQQAQAPAAEEDLEAALFGGGGTRAQPRQPAADRDAPAGRTRPIPPPPGGGRQQDLPRALSRGDIMQVVAGKRGDLRACADRQKAADPGSSGTVVMGWRIQPDGTPRNINVKSAEHRGTVMAQCLTQVIGTMRFPRYGGPQMQEIEFPFNF